MKYEITQQGVRVEAIGAHGGHRVRLSTVAHSPLGLWPVSVHVRGSESEDEVAVDVPDRHHASATDALDFGYHCAVLWIDARDDRLTRRD
ncbi:hypothetical protein [Piscinibacter sp. HJYY11]|uniref:hypothetical protein n=1 Tax=Piscinibacter sp. HJYY11 TaxID=2801333 RepID=UPI00191E8196|nr:hypothetical protein [Piscinibacter sp. HJYY11]MBL0730051.1 hypothetical protein [Piscinibacter sp. HJYY11]